MATRGGYRREGDIMDSKLEAAAKIYDAKGFAKRSGYGKHPALLIIDMTKGFTDPASPMGSEVTSQIEAIQVLLKEFRAQGLPIFYTVNLYDPEDPGGKLFVAKIPAIKFLEPGSEAVEVDDRLKPLDGERILEKKVPSAFIGTGLEEELKQLGVDTIFVTGVSTSACVRASTIDSMSHGYHAIVIRDAVGDRAAGPHENNLFDIDAKFGDVVSLKESMDYLATLAG
jgi:nicotinamidase-related amidase